MATAPLISCSERNIEHTGHIGILRNQQRRMLRVQVRSEGDHYIGGFRLLRLHSPSGGWKSTKTDSVATTALRFFRRMADESADHS